MSKPVTLPVSLAENRLNRVVSATLSGSSVSAKSGDITVEAKKVEVASALTQTTTVSDLTGVAPPKTDTVSLGGTFSANLLLGDVTVSISGSTVTTRTSGDVIVKARDESTIDAHAAMSATDAPGVPTFNTKGVAAGRAIAFNAIGWSFGSGFIGFSAQTIGTLIGVNAGATASITNASVSTTSGNIDVTANETATITAKADSSASSSGGSAFGTGQVTLVAPLRLK